MTVSGELAREAREMAFEDLPPAVVHEAKRRVLDAVACAVGGYSGNSSQVVQSLVRELGGPAEATVVGSGLRTSCLNAALANGVMVRYTEFMDEGFKKDTAGSFLRTGDHPGEVIPPILAVGERQHSTGKEVITAVVLGYELLSRFGEVFGGAGGKIAKLGWTNETMVYYIVPLVAGKLLGLAEEQMVNAIGISGSFVSGLKIVDDVREGKTMTRDLRFPFPAYHGILATLMAQKGFAGPSRVFEGSNGFAEVIARGNIELERLTQREEDFSILHTGTKCLAAFGRTIGPLLATLTLVKEHDIRPEQVAQVRVSTQLRVLEEGHAGAPEVHRYPQTKQAADHNLHYTTAVVIADRAVTPEQFTPEKLQDPAIRELIGKVTLKVDPQLEEFHSGGIVEIDTKGGATYTCRVDVPKGKPSNPMSDREIEEKFRSMAAKFMDEPQIKEAVDTIYKLDKLDDIGRLMRTLVFRRLVPSGRGAAKRKKGGGKG